MEIRVMTIEDYKMVYELWNSIKNFSIRSIDDSEEGIRRFLTRNPGTCVTAAEDGRVIGTILCGHDGRRASLYHVCVAEEYRKLGIGRKMTEFVLNELRREGINKVSLIAFKSNDLGNNFWIASGWTYRDDLNYYDYTLNECNTTNIVK